MSQLYLRAVRYYSYVAPQRVKIRQTGQAWMKATKMNTSRKKTRFSMPAVGPPSNTLEGLLVSSSDSNAHISRRVIVLNKIFMQNITDLLCTGEVCPELTGHNIEISDVRIGSEFNIINVSWIPKGDDTDDEIQNLLNKAAGPIRHNLSQRRIIGLVPRVQFIKDKKHWFYTEVDRRLKIADYPENYQPLISTAERIKYEFTQLDMPVPLTLKTKIMEFESNMEITEEEEEILPPMRLDAFGLDYGKIFKHVTAGMKNPQIGLIPQQEISKELLKKIKESMARPERSNSFSRSDLKKYIDKKRLEIRKMYKLQQKEWKRDIETGALFNKIDGEVIKLNQVGVFYPESFEQKFQSDDCNIVMEENNSYESFSEERNCGKLQERI